MNILNFNWLFGSLSLILTIWNLQLCGAASLERICPRIVHQVFEGYAPIGS